MISSKLLKYAAEKVEGLFKKFPVPAHGIKHVSRVVNYAREIAQREKSDTRVAELAAWLHDIGRISEYNKNPQGFSHQELSFELSKEWFKKDWRFFVLSKKEKEEILYAVKNHWDDAAKEYLTAVILRDADKLDLWGKDGLERHIEFNKKDNRILPISLVVNIERAKRLETKSAKEILKKNKMLQPLQDFLNQQKEKKGKILCALSGGVDSAVAAALLKKAGFEVAGAFIKCYGEKVSGQSCWIDERRDALRVAAKLGIKLITLDFEKEYRRDVINYIYSEYQAGRTPNPDVRCNKYVKIPLLIKEAKKSGFDYVATGHYARITSHELRNPKQKEYKLAQATDKNKDQTYFLHQLGQRELKFFLFPLAKLCKNEVRTLARDWGLPVAQKEESMGICFVGEVPMKKFLMKKIKSKPGKIVTSKGVIIGEHEGLAFYTIGQRSGFSLRGQSPKQSQWDRHVALQAPRDDSKPLFVVAKNIKKNQLIIGHENDPLLYKKEIIVKNVNWIAGVAAKLPLKCFVRLRHRQEIQEARITRHKSQFTIRFKKLQRAMTPGQFAVFYKNDECLGGGEIV